MPDPRDRRNEDDPRASRDPVEVGDVEPAEPLSGHGPDNAS